MKRIMRRRTAPSYRYGGMKVINRDFVVAAALVGSLSAIGYAAEKPAPPRELPAVEAARPAPAVTVARQAARAVLGGVGVESGVTRYRVDRAIAALERRVTRKSSPDALRVAFQAYYGYQAAHPEQIRKPYLYFVDYGLGAATPRGYVFDMKKLEVVDGPFTVAHGRGSAPTSSGIPTRFSNREGSNATSLGLYLAQETYSFFGKSGGRSYRSVGLRLRGLSGSYNSRARERGVVVHGAPYVTAGKAGRSEGCPAVEPSRAYRLIPRIANGGLVFLYSPRDREWLSTDPWVRAASGASRAG